MSWADVFCLGGAGRKGAGEKSRGWVRIGDKYTRMKRIWYGMVAGVDKTTFSCVFDSATRSQGSLATSSSLVAFFFLLFFFSRAAVWMNHSSPQFAPQTPTPSWPRAAAPAEVAYAPSFLPFASLRLAFAEETRACMSFVGHGLICLLFGHKNVLCIRGDVHD